MNAVDVNLKNGLEGAPTKGGLRKMKTKQHGERRNSFITIEKGKLFDTAQALG
jgi:hypothetical protein